MLSKGFECLVELGCRNVGAIAPFLLLTTGVAVLKADVVQVLGCPQLPPFPSVAFPRTHTNRLGLEFVQSDIGLDRQVHKLKGEEVEACYLNSPAAPCIAPWINWALADLA